MLVHGSGIQSVVVVVVVVVLYTVKMDKNDGFRLNIVVIYLKLLLIILTTKCS